jgi:ADP-ribose pyrophosphatase
MPRTIVHVGRKIQVALDTEVLPDGRSIRGDVVLHPGAVAILPLLDADHICLLRNHRPIIGTELWEIPAGTLEPNEPPHEAAVRELAEESGYVATKWTKLTELIPSPGVLSEVIHLYLAEQLTPGEMRPEADEQLEPMTIPIRQALTWAMDGTIRDAKTLIALFWLDRLRK